MDSVKVLKYIIDIMEYPTGLLTGVCDQLPGLVVPGRSEAEVREHLPEAIRQLLEAEGRTVKSVNVEPEQLVEGQAQRGPRYSAKAAIAA